MHGLNHQATTQRCQKEAASPADDADDSIFSGGGGFEEGDADVPPLETAETEWSKVYNLLSKEYPDNTARFLLAEYKETGGGRRAVVQHALGDDPAKETRGRRSIPLRPKLIYDSLVSKEEADLHFLIAATHYDGTEKSSHQHTTILREFAKESSRKRDEMLEVMGSSIKERLQNMTELAVELGGEQGRRFVAQLTNGFLRGVRDDVKKAQLVSDVAKFNFPTNDKDIWRQYTTGTFSIMNSLPCPTPDVVPGFGAPIPVESIVKHIIALNIVTKHFDKDED